MGVYIKGMEMPQNCMECPIVVCLKTKDECPLVPVPPHGRLIDADALVMENYKQYGALDALALEVIKAAPTVIEAEEGET